MLCRRHPRRRFLFALAQAEDCPWATTPASSPSYAGMVATGADVGPYEQTENVNGLTWGLGAGQVTLPAEWRMLLVLAVGESWPPGDLTRLNRGRLLRESQP